MLQARIGKVNLPYALIAALISLVLLLGCSKEVSEVHVAPLIDEYMATLKAKDYEKLLSFYRDDFFNVQSPGEWIDYLKRIRGTLGEIISVKQKQKQVNTVFSGRRFIYEYSVKYEKGYAKETIMFFQEVTSPDIKVQMHKIESPLLHNK